MRKTKSSHGLNEILLLLAVGVCAIQAKTAIADEAVYTYSLVHRTITLHEPVVLQFKVNNATAQPVQLDLGKNRNENFLISFSGPAGMKSQGLRLRTPGFGATGQVRIEPGETYAQNLLLNRWIDFDRPGKYEIEVHLAKVAEIAEGEPHGSMSGFHDTIEITAEDNVRLNEACASFAKQIEKPSSYQEAADAALALSFVKDPIAVPYLRTALFAKQLVEPVTIDGLEKIGDKEAVQILVSALTRLIPEDAALARAALERIRAKTSDPAIKQEIERGLTATRG